MSKSNKNLFEMAYNLLDIGKIKYFRDQELKILYNELNNKFEITESKNLESIIKEFLKQFLHKWQSASRTKMNLL